MLRKVAPVLAIIGFAFTAAVAIIAFGTGERMHSSAVELASLNPRQATILAIAKSLTSDHLPQTMSLKAANALVSIESLCGAHPSGGGTEQQAAYDRYRRRASANWWATIHAFMTEDEVKEAVMNDPQHAHVLIYVAPGWCHYSQMQVQELQKSFQDLGEAADRVHLIDVDDPENEELVKFQDVTSFPTIVVVQGNNILGKSAGYKDFDTINDMAFSTTEGVPFDSTFPGK